MMNETLLDVNLKVYTDAATASKYVAYRIATEILDKQIAGEKAVLGLATGSTPKKVYQHLINLHKNAGLSFENVYTFNLDEYYPMQPVADQSYVRFMNEQLFNHIDIPKKNIFIPDGTLSTDAIAHYCESYEQRIADLGGLDVQLLGIGRTGHVGFNEPGSDWDSTTRLVTLHDVTREDGAADFGSKENVPTQAITMGMQTICQAKKIILMAWGEHKASIIQRAIEGTVTADVPASYLQQFKNVEYIIDNEAAALLRK